MTDSTIKSGAQQAQEFSCGTCSMTSTQEAARTGVISGGTMVALADSRVEIWLVVKDAPGAIIEAQWPDGTWASIGSVVDGQLFNPHVHRDYLCDPQHIRLRIQGGQQVDTYPIQPILTSLSSRRNSDGSISVSGTTTLEKGTVLALSGGQFKSIGEVTNGSFSNTAVPSGYLYAPDTMRIRVDNDEAASDEMDSTLGFPHLRSVLIHPLQSSASEQQFMHWRHRKADYQPTGYFAPANTDVIVWVSGNAENLTLLVGIQGMADRADPSKQSESMRATPLAWGANRIRDPLGGAIHIRNLSGTSPGSARITFKSGAMAIPYFVRGVTTAAQWLDMLQASDAPEVELVGQHVVVAAFRSTALKFTTVDPAVVVDSHERVMAIQAEVSGLDGSAPIHTRSQLLLYAVESNSQGPPHATAGYIGLPHTREISAYNEALIGGLAQNRWVTYHEYGHHFQNSFISYAFVEISVNLYSLAVGRHFTHEYTEELPRRWPGTQQWLALPRPEKTFGAPESDPLAMFDQLRKGLGEDFLPAWHRYVRENPGPTADLKFFVVSASIAAGYSLINFFADWGLVKSTDLDVWAAVIDLDLPYPPRLLVAIRPYVD